MAMKKADQSEIEKVRKWALKKEWKMVHQSGGRKVDTMEQQWDPQQDTQMVFLSGHKKEDLKACYLVYSLVNRWAS